MSKYHCFTLNNYTDDEKFHLKALRAPEIVYLCFSEEIGEQGTPHLQGYVEFSELKKQPYIKQLFGANRVHLENRHGTAWQARDYCKYEDYPDNKVLNNTFYEVGLISRDQPKRKEDVLGNVYRLAKEGKYEEIPDKFKLLYFKTIPQLLPPVSLQPLDSTCGYWIWGPTGTGKSYMVKIERRFGDYLEVVEDYFPSGGDPKASWLIDEYHPKHRITAEDLKRYADRYPFTVRVKHGNPVTVRPEYVVITSNYSMEQCFSGVDLEPLKRRFTIIYKGKTPVPQNPYDSDATQCM